MARKSNPKDFEKIVEILKIEQFNVSSLAKKMGRNWQATNRVLTSMEYNYEVKLCESDDGVISIAFE